MGGVQRNYIQLLRPELPLKSSCGAMSFIYFKVIALKEFKAGHLILLLLYSGCNGRPCGYIPEPHD